MSSKSKDLNDDQKPLIQADNILTESNVQQEINKQFWSSLFAVSFYMTVSIALVFLNRAIFSDPSIKAGALFTSWFQFVVAYVIIVICATCCQKVPLLNRFPPINYEFDKIISVLPVSFSYLLMICFNNKCLEYVSVSAYQNVRSLTILFNIVFTYLILHDTTSFKACCACGGVVVGFYLGVDGEIGLTLKGGFYGVMSSIFVALYSIYVKKVMKLLDNNENVLIEYNTPLSIILLTPVVFVSGEFDVVKTNVSLHFWTMQTLAGVVGFVINIAIYLNIKYTTPLTHNLSGTIKACLQTLIAFVIFPGSEKMTIEKFGGTVLIIGFSLYYANVRKKENEEKLKAKAKENEAENK